MMRKFFKYAVSGALATGTTVFVAYALTEYFHVWYIVSVIIGFAGGVIVSFLLQKFWTFKDDSTEKIASQLSLYLVIAVLSLLLNTFIVYVCVEYFSLWYLLAQLFSAIIVAVFNFILYQYIVFRPRI